MDIVNEIEKVLENYNARTKKESIDDVLSLMNRWYVNDSKDFQARQLALDAAVKTISITGGDLTENAIKYKKFLLDQ
jgi:hypothetical protein